MSLGLETHGSGRPLVVVHGALAGRATWAPALPPIARGRAVHAVDIPGFGQSEPAEAPGEGFSIAAAAAAIGSGLVERVDPPFDLLGSGLGGAIALRLAARRPELVRRLILCAPAGFRPLASPLAAALSRAAVATLRTRRWAARRLAHRAVWRRALVAGLVDDAVALSAADARLLLDVPVTPRRLRAALAAGARADLRPDLEGLRRPLGLLWGGADRLAPAMLAERILALRPDAPLELVPEAGHTPQLERPAALAAALERVFERLAPG